MSEAGTLEERLAELGIEPTFVATLEAESIVVRSEHDPSAVLERIRICWTLVDELGVNLAGVEVVLHLLDRLGDERQTHVERLRRLRALTGDLDPSR